MKMTGFVASAFLLALLTGCAGTDFKRPGTADLALGKSTMADVTRVMGSPRQTGEILKNEQKVQMAQYAYAVSGGTGHRPGVIPARSMTFSTFQDVLVGEEFIGSFAEDATDFDDSKVSAIQKGKTTRDQVTALLGKPSGQALYPLIKLKTGNAAIYHYVQVSGTVFSLKQYQKLLIVTFDENNIVNDVEYVSNGTL